MVSISSLTCPLIYTSANVGTEIWSLGEIIELLNNLNFFHIFRVTREKKNTPGNESLIGKGR